MPQRFVPGLGLVQFYGYHPTHLPTFERRTTTNELVVSCSCGETWSHDANVTPARVVDTYEAHRAYYSREATKTL